MVVPCSTGVVRCSTGQSSTRVIRRVVRNGTGVVLCNAGLITNNTR